MQNRDTFSSFHPGIQFLYFALVLGFSMCFMHPVCLVVSLLSALTYSFYLRGRRAVRFSITVMLPMMLMAVLLNAAFQHKGVTILAYLPTGNPLTLESITYGVAAAGMLASVLAWFSCFNAVMTSDRFLYLFGRVIPAMALILSMTLRFVPRFTAQLRAVSDAQRGIGRDVSSDSLSRRLRHMVTILSILITWSLENAIETADSMRSRGYGLKGRTAFSLYRFQERDRGALLWLIFCGGYILCGWIVGGLRFCYYPMMSGVALAPFPVSFMLTYLALCLTPMAMNAKEAFRWKRLKSVS